MIWDYRQKITLEGSNPLCPINTFIYKLSNISYMVNRRECPYCKQIIEFEHRNGFASHCGNCKKRPGYWDGIKRMAQKRLDKRKDFEFKCKKCGKPYIVNLTPNQYKHKKYRLHCSQKCANSHIQTEKQNKRRSETILRKIKLGLIINKKPKGKLSSNYKESGCERVNREIGLKTFDKFKGICQKCGKQLKKKSNTWVAHHNNKHISKEEYYDDEDRILYCKSCHTSKHSKNVSKNELRRFRLFNYIDN